MTQLLHYLKNNFRLARLDFHSAHSMSSESGQSFSTEHKYSSGICFLVGFSGLYTYLLAYPRPKSSMEELRIKESFFNIPLASLHTKKVRKE